MKSAYRYVDLPRPAIFAHRGASAYAPENTLAAFRLAAEQGADALEFDVMVCASGEVVVIHDRTVDRTTDGIGEVSQMTLTQLKAVDAGVNVSADFRGERIPTLREVFEEFSGEIFMNIELKNNLADKNVIVQKVASLITLYRQENHVIVSSFDLELLDLLKKALPQVARAGLADEGKQGTWVYSWALDHIDHFDAIHPDGRDVIFRMVKVAHDRGQRIHPYTVDKPGQMRRLIGLGVDGFFTNSPDVARKVVDEGASEIAGDADPTPDGSEEGEGG